MAHSVDGGELAPKTTVADGVTYLTWTVVETDAAAATEFALQGVPEVGTIILVVTDLTTAGSATTMQTELGTVAGWTSEGIGHIAQATGAGSPIRIGQNRRFFQTAGLLYVRTVANATATTVTHTITIAKGHI